MKKFNLLLIISTLSISMAMAGQGNENLYSKLKSTYTESFSMSLSKDMIDFFDMDLDFNGKEKLITGDFHEGKMIVFKDVPSEKSITSIFNSEKYELVKDEDDELNADGNAYLYIKRNGATVSEAHFVVINEEKVTVLSVYGDIIVKNK